MNIESKYMIAIATLSDWLKRESKPKPCTRDLSALRTCLIIIIITKIYRAPKTINTIRR